MTRLTRRLLTAASFAAWCGVWWWIAIEAMKELSR